MAAPDATALLARLVARPSIAGGDNLELIADIATVLDEAGADVRVHDGTRPGTNVLHAVLGPADAPGGVLLAAHGDVVDVAGQTWTADPFALRADGGRLHGRGAADMKGFIAATLAAVSRADPSSLHAPLHVAISHDEELACAGIAPLLDALDASPRRSPAWSSASRPSCGSSTATRARPRSTSPSMAARRTPPRRRPASTPCAPPRT